MRTFTLRKRVGNAATARGEAWAQPGSGSTRNRMLAGSQITSPSMTQDTPFECRFAVYATLYTRRPAIWSERVRNLLFSHRFAVDGCSHAHAQTVLRATVLGGPCEVPLLVEELRDPASSAVHEGARRPPAPARLSQYGARQCPKPLSIPIHPRQRSVVSPQLRLRPSLNEGPSR